MPELPDITIYLEALERFTVGQRLERCRLGTPFLLRSVEPPITSCHGLVLGAVRRLGKRIVFAFEGDAEPEPIFLVLHLMVSGRLRWRRGGAKLPKKNGLAAFDFENGTLVLTEASTRKRASLYVVRGAESLAAHDPGGAQPLEITIEQLRAALVDTKHTLKRALTDPRILSGIGNAYSDEILHRARLSPFKWTSSLSDDELRRLYEAIRAVLTEWIGRLRQQLGDSFPDKVTAFHPEMAVHGRYRESCPVCGARIARIRYAENEANYCPGCQTDGKLLADRSLSRLLKKDWPRSTEELESLVQRLRG